MAKERTMRERDITTAYVASACWVLVHCGLAAAQLFQAETIGDGLGGGEEAVVEWDAACDELVEYARRQGEQRRAEQFALLKVGPNERSQ